MATLLAALTLALLGCSDDDPEPKRDPTPTTSTSTSVSPTPEPTEPAARLDPKATVRAWVAARNLAMSRGDVTEVRRLSAPECTSCADLIDPIAETFANGGRYETAGWRVLRSRVTDRAAEAAEVTAALVFAGGTTYLNATDDPVVYEAERRITIFELTKSRGGWAVSLIGFVR
ncbi:MAG: hypothetical protein Q8Q52_08295 [Acidimicrobiia bacterium]|nr:hypothetical protein [Acidimicrobiia bacterium]